jgi:hypothetical protein
VGPDSTRDRARTIHVGDGVRWLEEAPLATTQAIVTSLPDASELPSLTPEGWRAWFVATATLVCSRVAEGSVAVFYQTDVIRDGCWVDKAFLVASAAEQAGAGCLFHKVVCRVPAGIATFGRPGYAHLMGFSRGLRTRPADATADVLPELGAMSWSRAMGTAACEATCRFLLRSTACREVIDPFCGRGTMLAVANAYGLDAIGIERSRRRAALARRLRFEPGTGLR